MHPSRQATPVPGGHRLLWLELSRDRVHEVKNSVEKMHRWLTAGVAAALALVVAAGPAMAQLEVFGGATYNTYAIDWEALEGLPIVGPVVEELSFDQGLGLHGGLQWWLSERVAVGGQIDWIEGTGSADSATLRATALGYLARVTTDLSASETFQVQPFGAIGLYTATARLDRPGFPRLRAEADPQVGGLLGLTIALPLTSQLKLHGTLGYRRVTFTSGTVNGPGNPTWDDPDLWDMSGLTAGLGVTLAL